MDALALYQDIVDLCVSSETCPHGALSHVSDVPNMDALTTHVGQAVVDTFTAYAAGQATGDDATNALVHALVLMAGVGYAIGAEQAYDIVLSSDITVPDSLAAMDWLESTGMDGRGADSAPGGSE